MEPTLVVNNPLSVLRRKKTPRLKYSDVTHVRNQYETINSNTGELANVHYNDYNVNSRGNNAMPGYAMNKKRFTPHSKSALIRVNTEMARLRRQKRNEMALRDLGLSGKQELNGVNLANLKTGWNHALSSVGPNEATNFPNAFANLAYMKNTFGNAWTNAEAVRENALLAQKPIANAAAETLKRKMLKLEAEFLQAHGLEAPSVIRRKYLQDLEDLRKEDLRGNSYRSRSQIIQEGYDAQMASFTPEVKAAFMTEKTKIGAEYTASMNSAKAAYRGIMNQVKKGSKITKKVNRPLANRLRNAQAIANAEGRS